MAITLVSDYSKKLGLPGFSSHQFSVSIQTELTDLAQVPGEVARLYQLLQSAVDREIQATGFIPGHDYGEVSLDHHNANHGTHPQQTDSRPWQCSDKQRQLIGDLSEELQLTDDELDARAQRLFQQPAPRLNKLAASGLISDLLAEAGTKRLRNGHGNGNGKGHQNGSRQGHTAAPHRNGGGA